MRYDVVDSLDWLFVDSEVRDRPRRTAVLVAPRGGRPGFQVLPQGSAGTESDVEVGYRSSDLTSDHGAKLKDVSASLLHSVPVEENTGVDGFTARNRRRASGVSRRAPFRCFDALEPITEGTRAVAGEPPACYVQVSIPPSTPPGEYSGNVDIAVGGEHAVIPIRLTVAGARLPTRPALSRTTWFGAEVMATYHGLTLWSPAHWRMIRRYADHMVAGHHDTFRAPFNMVEGRRAKDGTWSFDFKRLGTLMHTMIEAGMTRIEGGHLGGAARWGAPELYVNISGAPEGNKARMASGQGQEFLSQFLPAWRAFLERRGWYELLCQHVADEPTEGALCDYMAGACAVRKHLPGIPIIDAVEYPHLGAAVDWWVPKIDDYERDREIYDEHRSHGDRIWCYTCCKPGGRFMNRLLDFPLLRTRLLAWGCAKYDLAGYLHWALNSWEPNKTPFEQSVKREATLEPDGTRNDIPAGDKSIIYPGPDGPWSSMRSEAQREGWEDHALLMMAKKRLPPERFAALVSKTVRSFSDFTDDPALFRRQYGSLLKLVSG